MSARSGSTYKRSRPHIPSIKKGKLQTWTHSFVCLSDVDSDRIPDMEDRAKLIVAGLGERKVQLDCDADARDVKMQLELTFPKLLSSGGFELLRGPEGGGKLLTPITIPPTGYSATYLKTVVHSAKIYIRPIQRNLNLDPVQVTDEVICQYCC